MATLTETMSVFRMPSRYICNAFFRARLFLVQFRNDFVKIQNDEHLNWNVSFFSNASSRVENAFSALRMPFRRFLRMPPSRIRNASFDFENASQRIENASLALRMLFKELEVLLTIWERFSKNWECFSRFENAFRKIENASHALRMLFEKLKMLFERLKMLPTLWECFSKDWKCFCSKVWKINNSFVL